MISASTRPTGTPTGRRNVLAGVTGMAVVVWLGFLFFSQPIAGPSPAALANAGGPATLPPCLMDKPGYLNGTIFGSISLAIDWRGAVLACDGDARPGDNGLRLFFAGRPEGGPDRIVLLLGIEARAEEFAAREYPVRVTLLDETGDVIYHSGPDRCWTKVTELSPLHDVAARSFRVDGALYCLGAIPSLSDQSSITLGDITYSGRLRLDGA
jgi:hypothetical protein